MSTSSLHEAQLTALENVPNLFLDHSHTLTMQMNGKAIFMAVYIAENNVLTCSPKLRKNESFLPK